MVALSVRKFTLRVSIFTLMWALNALLSDAAFAGSVGRACTYKDFPLYGKVKVVTSFPDLKVQVVDSFPDLKVKLVTSFPSECGKWQMTDNFPDLKIQFVESFPDIKIQYVESFPGIP
jgi:hypothetical protein